MDKSSRSPFAYVKYPDDYPNDKPVKVPQNYIKDFIPSTFTANMVAKVFWSPKGQTPSEVLRSQGHILDLTEEIDKAGGKGEPLAGYYRAIILQIADSEDELDKVTLKKRLCKPSQKVLESTQSQSAPKQKIKAEKRRSKAKKKEDVKESDKITITKMKSKYVMDNNEKCGSSKNKGYQQESGSGSSEDENSDDELVPKRMFKEKMRKLEKENERLQQRNQQLEEKSWTLMQKNLEWQEKFLHLDTVEASSSSKVAVNEVSALVGASSSSKVAVHEVSALVEARSSSKVAVNEVKMTRVESDNNEMSFESNNEQEQKVDANLEEEGHANNDGEVDFNPHEKEDAGNDKDLIENPDSDDTVEEKVALTPRKLKMCLSGVKPGVKGDTLYIRNLSMAIFGEDTLINSSCTGKRAQGGRKKQEQEEAPRPPLPQAGMLALEDAFNRRLDQEKPAPDEQERKKRNGIIRDTISQKIKYLRHKMLEAD